MPETPVPDWEQPPPRKSRSGWLIGLSIGCGLVLLLCCGGGALLTYWGQQYAKDVMSQDPATIQARTQEIAPMVVPAPLEPLMAMNMRVPFSDQVLMVMVLYQDVNSQSMLILAKMGEMAGAQDPEAMRMQIEASLRQQGQQQNQGPFVAEKTAVRTFEIHGQPATMTFQWGKNPDTNQPRLHVSGALTTPQGAPAMLILDVDTSRVTEEQVMAMILSIPGSKVISLGEEADGGEIPVPAEEPAAEEEAMPLDVEEATP